MSDSRRPYVDRIEQAGWQLYDVTPLFGGQPPSSVGLTEEWGLIDKLTPVGQVEMDHAYRIVPKSYGQSGSEAHEAFGDTFGGTIGPSLKIGHTTGAEYNEVRLTLSPTMAFFTHIALRGSGVVLFTPEYSDDASETGPDDLVELATGTAQQIFERDFNVLTLEEFGRVVHGMPPDGEM